MAENTFQPKTSPYEEFLKDLFATLLMNESYCFGSNPSWTYHPYISMTFIHLFRGFFKVKATVLIGQDLEFQKINLKFRAIS